MIKHGLLEFLYPNKCAGCDDIIDEGKQLCEYCSIRINNVDYGKLCTKCGFLTDYCRCSFREFHYSGALGMFKNNGVAREAYYSYKMGRNESLAPFFARRTANAVKKVFAGIAFDAVVCVPTARRSRLKRGFDHNAEIASRLADILKIRFLRGALKTKHFKPLQHKSSFTERLENVRGKYYTDKRINAQRVLLFDDISTTGATLDECAKELMFAGVKEVYCVTVLATYPKKKTNGGK